MNNSKIYIMGIISLFFLMSCDDNLCITPSYDQEANIAAGNPVSCDAVGKIYTQDSSKITYHGKAKASTSTVTLFSADVDISASSTPGLISVTDKFLQENDKIIYSYKISVHKEGEISPIIEVEESDVEFTVTKSKVIALTLAKADEAKKNKAKEDLKTHKGNVVIDVEFSYSDKKYTKSFTVKNKAITDIYSLADFKNIKTHLSGAFDIYNDIVLNDKDANSIFPITNGTKPFKGTLEGVQGESKKNIEISNFNHTAYILLGAVSGATIKNITIIILRNKTNPPKTLPSRAEVFGSGATYENVEIK